MKKVLVIADSPTCNTGFGNVTRNVLENVSGFEFVLLGVNYYGDPHELQSKYKIYNPAIGRDVYGFGRIPEIIGREKPDLIWLLNDIWLCAEYVRAIRQVHPTLPIVIYTPIDAENIKRDFIDIVNDPLVSLATYTDFAKNELIKSGYKQKITVIPHGIDRKHFNPISQDESRSVLFAGSQLAQQNPFTVLYVARNQPRKRVDLFLYIIAEWIKKYPHDNVFAHYHGSTQDIGIDVEQWAQRLGIDDRLILTAKNIDPATGIPLDKMKYIYNSASVYFQVCAVEGWGMPLHEAMACKIPAIVPDYSALSDWPSFQKTQESVYYVPTDGIPWINPNGINTVHYTVDVHAAIEALETLYQDTQLRHDIAECGYTVATDERYNWANIGKAFKELFTKALQYTALPSGDVLRVWKKK